jgi:hypothetical protein
LNSLHNDQGKRTWVRTEEVDRILGGFDLLLGYNKEVDDLMIESLKEVGFREQESPYFDLCFTLKSNVVSINVEKWRGKWRVKVGGGGNVDYVVETILIPRAMWGDIRMAWERYQRVLEGGCSGFVRY